LIKLLEISGFDINLVYQFQKPFRIVVMKKKATLVIQPDKTETSKSELLTSSIPCKKMYRDHSLCDHSHGRVNKFPFGSSHGPTAF